MERDSSAQPLLSVVTICYNAEKTIGNTIQSVISQGFDDYEYIIIDGASTDGTLKILNQYADKNPKMKVFSEKDSGISDAFNKGIMKSKGILIGLLNADDSYCRGALTAIADKYNATEADIIYGDAVIVDEKNGIKTLKKAKPLSRLDYELPFIHQSCFVSKQAYQKYGLYDTSYKICMDYDCLARMRGVKFAYAEAPISQFAYGGTSCEHPFKTINEDVEIARKYGLSQIKAFSYKAKMYTRNAIKLALIKIGLWGKIYNLKLLYFNKKS